MENPLHGAKESPNGTSPSEITPLLTFPEKEDSIEKENSALGRSFLIQIFHSIFTSQKSENQKPLNRYPSSLTPCHPEQSRGISFSKTRTGDSSTSLLLRQLADPVGMTELQCLITLHPPSSIAYLPYSTLYLLSSAPSRSKTTSYPPKD